MYAAVCYFFQKSGMMGQHMLLSEDGFIFYWFCVGKERKID